MRSVAATCEFFGKWGVFVEHADLLSSVGICITAAALAFVGNWLKQPLLLAYLLAGALIGPRTVSA